MSCNIVLERLETTDVYTLSQVFIDDIFFGYAIEDAIREKKIHGITAIPRGTYKVAVTMSPRFKKMLPLLFDVPNFTGVRIHAGNDETHSEGCIILGLSKGILNGKVSVLDSRKAMDRLMKILKYEKDITITLN